jgi:hypothetical protein
VEAAYANGTLTASDGYVVYKWYRDGQPLLDADARTYQPDRPGRYKVLVMNQEGCSAFSPEVVVESAGVAEAREPAGSLSIYPHPARDRITIDLQITRTSSIAITLTSIDGTIVRSITSRAAPTLKQDVLLNGLAAGIYMLTVETENGRWVRKVIKE